jgi:UDP-glucose 4-epimerase
MNILVTGGAGFIGSHIVDKYIKEGHRVIIVDNLSTGFKKNINPKAFYYKIDICSKKLEGVFRKHKIQVINHHAAQVDLKLSFANPEKDARVNIEGSLNLFQLAVKYKVKKIILASTGGAIYGEQEYYPADEKHISNPLSPYGISKYTVEQYLEYYHRFFGIDYVCLRYSNVYGPRQLPKGEAGVVAVFCGKILKCKQPVIYGNGLNTRDFVFVYDVVDANIKALSFNRTVTINIATGKETNINKVFGLINNFYGKKVKVKHIKGIEGEQKRSLLDNKLAKKLLNWTPKYDIKDGIEETCRYFIKNIK